MSVIKEWASKKIYELFRAGYSEEEIALILECELEFVHSIVGAD